MHLLYHKSVRAVDTTRADVSFDALVATSESAAAEQKV